MKYCKHVVLCFYGFMVWIRSDEIGVLTHNSARSRVIKQSSQLFEHDFKQLSVSESDQQAAA